MIEILLEKWVKITARNIVHLHKLLLEGDMVQQVKTRGVFWAGCQWKPAPGDWSPPTLEFVAAYLAFFLLLFPP